MQRSQAETPSRKRFLIGPVLPRRERGQLQLEPWPYGGSWILGSSRNGTNGEKGAVHDPIEGKGSFELKLVEKGLAQFGEMNMSVTSVGLLLYGKYGEVEFAQNLKRRRRLLHSGWNRRKKNALRFWALEAFGTD